MALIPSFLHDILRRVAGRPASQPPSPKESEATWKGSIEDALTNASHSTITQYARNGFPAHLRGWTWCRILRTDRVPEHLKNFERELLAIFGTTDPQCFQAPCFGGPLNIDEIDLSAERRRNIGLILCIVGSAHPHLEYTPIIPAIIAILSKFLEPDDVLACLASMIEGHSIPAAKREEWAYFPLHRRDYLVFERVFEDLIRTFVPKVAKHVAKLQLLDAKFVPEWDRILSSIFVGILPRDIVVRIFDSYVVEGYKTILRFAIAHLIVRQGDLLQAQDGAAFDQQLLARGGFSQELLAMYIDTAFKVKFDRALIKRYRNRRRKHSISDFDDEDKLLIFHRPLPLLSRPSTIVRNEDWLTIWSWIPPRFRLLNLELAFTSAEHGTFLVTLLSMCRGSEPLLLLIETYSHKIFGAYVSKALTTENGPLFYGTGETFLFALQPVPLKFPWNVKSGSNAFICVSESFLAFGAGNDFGLWIDRSLTRVTSAPSVTFDNPPLINMSVEEDARIFCVEVFKFA